MIFIEEGYFALAYNEKWTILSTAPDTPLVMITHIFVESGIKYCVSRQNSGRFSDDYPY
jgi:hypothetical protein